MVEYVDYFFKAVGIIVLEGYGLTETGPVLSVRRVNRPIAKTVGPFLPDIEYRVIDSNGNSLLPGEKGELWVKSPQVMSGYFKNEIVTKDVLTKEGWFKTGDLVRVTIKHEISIVGRSKDTIVLREGKILNLNPLRELYQNLYLLKML